MRSSRGVVCILAVAALAGALGCSGSGQQASDTDAATETEGSAPIGDPPSVQERKASDRIALELYDARGRRVGWVDFWQLREGGVTLFEVAPREIWSAPLLLRAGTCRKNVARTWSRLDGWNESPWTPAELRGSTWAIDLHGG